MIPDQLELLTVKRLAELAKKSGIRGWHEMRKAELISALKKLSKAAKNTNSAKHPKLPKTTVKSKTQTATKTTKPTKSTPQSQQVSEQHKKKVSVNKSKTAAIKTPKTAATQKKTEPKSQIITSGKKTSAANKKAGKTSNVASRVVPKKEQASVTPAVSSSIELPVCKPKPKPKPKQEQPLVVVDDHDAPFMRKIGLKESLTRFRELGGVSDGEHLDRLVLFVRDPHWLQVVWELNVKQIDRARAAMGVEWHTSVPILRLYQIISDGISRQHRAHVRDVQPRGQANNWYLDVQDSPACFFVEIGYLSSKGRFFPLVSSNTVETPESHTFGSIGASDSFRIDMTRESEHGFTYPGGSKSERYERKNGLDDHVRRSVPTPMFARFGDGPIESVKVELEVDVVIYGKTLSDAQLTIKNEPVRLQSDGRFSFRFQLPEKRQVYPIVAVSSDGIESQTTILAIDRNTKTLETVYREHDEIE